MSDTFTTLDGITVDDIPVKFNSEDILTDSFEVDPTLTVSGAAADAKVTGDEIGALKEELHDSINAIVTAEHAINLFDEDFDENGYINPSTGENASSADYKRTSKFYEITDNTATTIYGLLTSLTATFTMVFYDATKTKTGYYGKSTGVTSFNTTIPQNTKYFRIYTNASFDGNACVSTVYTSEYVPYSNECYLNAKLKDGIIELINMSDDIIDDSNMIQTIFDNTYLNYSTGTTASNSAYRASDYIEIEPNTAYYFGIVNVQGAPSSEVLAMTVTFYDANKNGVANTGAYLSGFTMTNCVPENGMQKVTSPATAKYCRVGTNDNADKKEWFFGTDITRFVYNKRNGLLKKNFPYIHALSGKVIACFGDSIIGNTRDYTSTSAYISEATGATVYNFGFGGCRMSVHASGWDNCSMYRLADDIYNNDFSELVSAINTGWSGMPGYFRNTVAWLDKCDFSKVDAILVAYGTNDYREPTSVLDNPSNPLDTSTVCGALRYSLKQILSKYPNIQILVTCPIFRTFFVDETTTPSEYSDTKDWGSGTLLDYAEAYKKACNDMNVPFLDLYHETSFNPYTRLHFYPADDGTHPNEYGRRRIGTIVGGRFKGLLMTN